MKFRWQSRKCVKDHASYVIVVVLREKTTQLEMIIHYVSKKGATFIFVITLANVDRFLIILSLFYSQIYC